MLLLGTTINHPKWGKGAIIDQRHRSFELYVQFKYDKIWVKASDCLELKEDEHKATSGVLPPEEEVKPVMTYAAEEEVNNYRQIIEAFRLGIVPSFALEKFTVGLDDERERIDQWLNSFSDKSNIFLIGDYGSGKTHLMEYIRYVGLKKGYAVAFVDVEPNECSFHRCKQFYKKIIETFRYNTEKDFEDFFNELQTKFSSIREHIFLFLALQNINNEVNYEEILRWLQGDNVKPRFFPALYDDGVSANIYCYILSGIGYGLKIMGLKGLILLLDEGETLSDKIGVTGQQFQKGFNFLKGLLQTAMNKDYLLKEKIHWKTGSYDSSYFGGYFGEQSDLIYSGRTRLHELQTVLECKDYPETRKFLPYLYKIPSNIKIVTSFTSDNVVQDLSGYNDEDINSVMQWVNTIKLGEFSSEQKTQLFRKIYEAYIKAHPSCNINATLECRDLIMRKTAGDNLRAFIKATVELFDILRLKPNSKLNFIE